ncbi:MAG: hypothetical protein LUG99_14255 [Lachnospiraceae bacterium]|nr:hypothetical protein [Lachnospiraceae bacterium]
MGQYDFTYVIPEAFKKNMIQYLTQDHKGNIAQAYSRVHFEYNDLGYAYYSGLSGDNWNKRAIDITLEGSEKDIELLRSNRKILENAMGMALKPTTSGFLLKNIYFIVSDDDFEVELPDEKGESFDVLSQDIHDALAKGEPVLVLDRLHTYSSKYLREICVKHGIDTEDSSGEHYALHSLAGMITKYYKANNVFQSEFTEQALKMSISSFEKYNRVRNDLKLCS